MFERCAQYLAKCRPARFAKEKYQSCPREITNFCGRFESDFPLAFRWCGLKPIDYSAVKSFDEGMGFSWRDIEIWALVILVGILPWVRLLMLLGLPLHW